jgi:hypothetical protein
MGSMPVLDCQHLLIRGHREHTPIPCGVTHCLIYAASHQLLGHVLLLLICQWVALHCKARCALLMAYTRQVSYYVSEVQPKRRLKHSSGVCR